MTGSEMNRNWSPVPWIAAPAAVTVSAPPVVCSAALAGLRMSWQVKRGRAVRVGGRRGRGGAQAEGVQLAVDVADVELALGDRDGAVDRPGGST